MEQSRGIVACVLVATWSLGIGDLEATQAITRVGGGAGVESSSSGRALRAEGGCPPALFVISAPGSFVANANVNGVSGQAGVAIDASDVTIDLNGHTLRGVPGSLDGFTLCSNQARIEIKNGVVTGWGGTGIMLNNFDPFFGATATDSIVRDVRVTDNGQSGVTLGANGMVADSVVSRNGSLGVEVSGGGGSVQRSLVVDNGNNGITVSSGSLVSDCVSVGNLNGIVADRSVIQNNTVRVSTLIGISAGQSLIKGNAVTQNGGSEIEGPGSTLVDNHTEP